VAKPRVEPKTLTPFPTSSERELGREPDARRRAMMAVAAGVDDGEMWKDDPVMILRQFVFAVALGHFPPARICEWLADRFEEYEKGDGRRSLDFLLGLVPAKRDGPGNALARHRLKTRNELYCREMFRLTAAGASNAAAARAIVETWQPIMQANRMKPLAAETLCRFFESEWSKDAAYADLDDFVKAPPAKKKGKR
jgi:hypothetical protein